jgi:pimeloyl-ACP methyl ester carboxylesterase
MAARYPGRVAHIVYLDAAYDWADPDFHAAFNAIPSALLEPPAAAMVSMGAYRSYEKAMFYRRLDDMARIDAHLRQSVVIRPDGHVETRMRQAVLDSLYDALWINPPRDYTHVRCPALAIYPQDLLDIEAGDAQQRSVVLAFEQHYWAPFRTKSIERVRRELAQVEILRVAGTHDSFFLTERQQIVAAVRRFLGGSGTTPGN